MLLDVFNPFLKKMIAIILFFLHLRIVSFNLWKSRKSSIEFSSNKYSEGALINIADDNSMNIHVQRRRYGSERSVSNTQAD